MGKLPPEVTGEKMHGLNETQKMLRDKGYPIKNSLTGVGYVPHTPVRIVIRRAINNYISEEEYFSTNEKDVYIRVTINGPAKHKSEELEETRKSVFQRLGKPSHSVF